MAKFYNVHGDCRQLEFSVELSFLCHSASLSALNFDAFLRNARTNEHQRTRAVNLESEALFGDQRENRILLERRTIRWQEVISRPTIVVADPIGGAARENREEDEEEEDGEEKLENEEQQKEGEAVPEDPTQSWPSRRKRNRETPKRQRLSHHIFTLLDDFPVASSTEGEAAPKQQHLRQPKRINAMEHAALQEPIRWDLSAEQKRRNREATCSEQRMRLMAYLGEAGKSYNPSEECLLWELTLLNGRLLGIQPDFGPRLIHSRNGTFEALIVPNEQIQFDRLEERFGQETEADTEEQQDWTESSEMAEERDEGQYWLHYLLQIASATNFPTENLHVQWQLDLPANVQLRQPEMAKGRTQQCDTKAVGQEDICHFCHLVQFSLNRLPANNNCPATARTWPRILFRVASEDCWGRLFVQGYASLPLPSSPGREHIKLECWQPMAEPGSKLAALQNAHLGQAVDLIDFRQAGPREADGTWPRIYSRAGLNTMASGQLCLEILSMHQCRQFVSRDVLSSLRYSKMTPRAGLDRALHWRISKVLEEFERARRQLMTLRRRKRDFALH